MSASEEESGSSSGSEGEAPELALPSSKAPFEKISCLGEGAFGAVWLARSKSSGQYVALKEIGRHHADVALLRPERDLLRRIADEGGGGGARPLTGLVATYTTPFAVCLAMELVEGTHLFDHLKAEKRFTEDRVQWYASEIAGALEWLHSKGWLYRDLKLTNVMLSISEKSYGRVKLIDFGFAHEGLWSDQALGTLQTMAPEVIACAKSDWLKDLKLEAVHDGKKAGYGPQADWWSLGVILFELLTGEVPFGRHDDLLLEGFRVLQRQQEGWMWPDLNISSAAKEAAGALCQLKPHERLDGQSLRHQEFFQKVPWEALEEAGPGPGCQRLGFTIASASEEENMCRPRRVMAMPVTLEGAESDMLCLVVRLLAQQRFRSTRLVIMSATLQSGLFATYFATVSPLPVGNVFVGARCFKVTEYFLEDLPKAFRKKLRCESLIQSRIKEVFGLVKPKKIDQKHCDKMHSIILELLEVIASPDSTILVFLPGIAEISALWQEARDLEHRGFRIFPLHSMVPREEQELVFQEPEPGITNVVLATDIAESSITLPHVVAVVDLGLHRRMDHDASKGIASLATKWISKAAATQRSGRAGRTQPGLCLRLYTQEFFNAQMHDFEPPESKSMALDRLYLQAKQLSVQLNQSLQGYGAPQGAQQLLSQLPEAPDLKNVTAARQKNAELGTISDGTEAAKITALGYLCLQLPLELKLTRLVWLGAHFGVVADAVVLASVMSSQDAFSMPSPLFMREELDFVSRLRSAASARLLFDSGELSEPLMHRQLFLEWLTEFHQNQYVCGDKEKVLWARR
ncbi:unnamed protein product, partial [Durusdinium trenchii]